MITYTPEHVRSLKMPEQPLLSDALEAFAARLEKDATSGDMLEDLRWLAQRCGGVVDPSRLSRYLEICKRWKV